MTFMAFLLMIILFVLSFLYFWGINPQDITVFYFPEKSFTYPASLVVVGSILIGLILGYLAHLYSTVSHLLKHWKRDRAEKKAREVATIYREGVGRLLSGDIKKAHSLLQKALDRDPSRVETYIAMANVHMQEGEPQEGISLLRKARGIDPKSLEVLFKLAAIYEEIGQDADAIQSYQGILAVESDNRKALRSLRDIHIREGRWKEAAELQKKILKVTAGSKRLEEEKQKSRFLRYEVARTALKEGDIDEAKAELKEIVKESTEFVPARVSLGDAYRAQGRSDEAVRIWSDGYQALGKSIFLSRLEDIYMEAEDPASLLSFYRSTLLERGDDLMFRLFYGKFCLRLEMVDEALEQLYAVESAGVDFPQLHVLLAEAHRRRNRLDQSINEYKKALGISTRLRLDYVCDVCGETSPEWQSSCQDCGTWGSFSLVGRQLMQSARPVELRAIHHGEREEWNED